MKFKLSKKFIEEQHKLYELLDRYIKVNVDKRTEKQFTAHFVVPPVAGLNDTGSEITYYVSLTGSGQGVGLFEINNEDGKGYIKCHSADLQFRNSRSGMNQLSTANEEGTMVGVNAAVVFTTVVKCVDVYVQKYKPQCIKFYPAHNGLTNSYIILCKVAARQFGYKWVNDKSVMANRGGTPHFYLLHKDIYEKWIKNRVPKATSEA